MAFRQDRAMRKLVALFAATTVAFTGTTIYLWRELAAERARQVAPARLAATAAPAAPPAAAPEPASAAVAVPAKQSKPPSTPASPRLSREQRRAQSFIDARKQLAANAPAFLASLGNAQRRADMVAEYKRSMRLYSPGLQRYLGLSDETYDRLLDALADVDLAGREAMSRCALDSNCPFPDWDRSVIRARRRDALSQFGTETADKYDFYARSGAERQLVAEFRGRLDDATRLTDAQSEELARALMEAHETIRQDLEKTPRSISNIAGVAYAQSDLDDAEDDGVDRTEEIAGFNRQLREGAASVLTAAQLAIFDQMQQEALEQARDMRRDRRRRPANASN